MPAGEAPKPPVMPLSIEQQTVEVLKNIDATLCAISDTLVEIAQNTAPIIQTIEAKPGFVKLDTNTKPKKHGK